MAPLKRSDFEGGSLTGANGFDTLTGTELTLNTTGALYGGADVAGVYATGASYGAYTSATLGAGGKATLYAAINGFRMGALPGSDWRIVTWRNGVPANVYQLFITSAGKLKVTVGATTVTGTTVLAANTTYRIGMKYVAGTGANAIGEVYVAAGNAAFGAAEISITTANATTNVTDPRFGYTAGIATAPQPGLRMDEVTLDDAAMPGPVAVGATYYLATTGSDAATGLVGAPWATLDHALRQLQPGDTLNIGPGNFDGAAIGVGGVTPGTASNRVTIVGDAGWGTWITGLDAVTRMTNAHYWTFTRVNFDGKQYAGADVDLFIPRGDGIIIEKAIIRNNPNPLHADPTRPPYPYRTFKALMSIDGSNVSGGTEDGVSVNMEVRYCRFLNNLGINWGADGGQGDAQNQDHCIYITDGKQITIHHCIFEHTPNGRAIKIGMSSDPGATVIPDHVTVQYNTFVHCTGPGSISLSYSASNSIIDHNIFVGPTTDDALPTSSTGSGLAPFVYTSNLTASGTNNVVTNNYGWLNDAANHFRSTGFAGLTDSGNTYADPLLDNQFVPHLAALFAGGVYTHGHLQGFASAAAWPGPPGDQRLSSRQNRLRRRRQ